MSNPAPPAASKSPSPAFALSFPLALATIADQEGSAPRGVGARMLIRPDSSIRGTIGGGKYEALVIARAVELMAAGAEYGTAGFMDFSLRGSEDLDMICGGALKVLLEVFPDDRYGVFHAAREAHARDRAFYFLTRVFTREEPTVQYQPGAQRCLFLPDTGERLGPPACLESWAQLPPAHASRAFKNQGARLVSRTEADYLTEYFPPPERVFIFGAGHVGRALSELLPALDFTPHALDDRPEFADPARFHPKARVTLLPSLDLPPVRAWLEAQRPGPHDAVVIVTRGHARDRECLEAALGTPAGYIGMIGSRSKRDGVYSDLRQKGLAQEDFNRVRAPVGIAIGAQTPEEIAVSIAGELIAWRHAATDA